MRPPRIVVSAGLAALTLAAAVPGEASAQLASARVCPSGPPACDFATIPEAIAAVDEWGIVRVAPGTYAGGFTITKDVRVVGAGTGQTEVSGESIAIAPGVVVLLEAMTVADAADTPQIVNDGNLTLRAVDVRPAAGDFSSREVAGILSYGELMLHGSTVTGPGSYVGGILNHGTASLAASTVSHSSGDVGGIFNTGSLTIKGSDIVDNFAGFDGAIRNEGSLVVRNSDISGNGGQGPGGLSNDPGAEAVVVDTTMLDNELSGIFNAGSLTLRRVTLGGWGTGLGSVAGIWNQENGSAVIAQSTLDGSDVQYTPHRTPPAIDNQGEMVVGDSVVRDSHSTQSGGGIVNEGSLTLRTSAVTGNTSDASGGGVFNTGSLTLRWSTITANTALDLPGTGVFGGGIANESPGVVALRQSTVSGNTPDDCAGC